MLMCVCMSSCVSGVQRHACASPTSGCAFACCPVLRKVHLYFKPRVSGIKRENSGDVSGSIVLFQVLYY